MPTGSATHSEKAAAEVLATDWDDRLSWKHVSGTVTANEILRGSDQTDFVVVSAVAPRTPPKGDLQAVVRARARGGVTPILLVVGYPTVTGTRYALLGPDEDCLPVYDVDATIVEQLTHDALESTSPSGLQTELRRRLGTIASGVGSGLRNEGLLASHILEQQPDAPEWAALCAQAANVITQRGRTLLTGLGYAVEAVPDGAVLRASGNNTRTAAAVVLADSESFDNPLGRLHGSNAVVHGLALARREHLDWLVVIGGTVLRLYAVDPDVGVGRKGQTQTFVELDLSLLTGDRSGYLPLLFGPLALADNGTIAQLLSDSAKFASALSERLRDRIYDDVIPVLAKAVADRMKVAALAKDEQRAKLDEAYHKAMIILFRLLFVAYAEDRKLLPYEVSEQYTRNALKTLAQDMIQRPDRGFDAHSTSLWDDLTQVWKVIDTGDIKGWGVPPYNGGLFTRNSAKNKLGADTYSLDLTNNTVGRVLRGLLVDRTADGDLGPVDFRSLSVREFGTIYEGLLESGLGVAESDLALSSEDTYVPAISGAAIAVHEGEVYFHSLSGSRKATGSYFTKPFAVEHLLDSALEPAIDAHLTRVKRLVDKGATKSAAEAFFDFRVADLSMGSAHFLVAAVDRVEVRFSAFLAQNPLPEVAVELHELRTVAATQLGLDVSESGIDDASLLRRQIARRCVYGLDINEIAVELARLGLWIHTFVKGLPLSFLNHSLVWGNSLTGVGTISEIVDALAEAETRELRRPESTQIGLLDDALHDFLDRASEFLAMLGAISDASISDVDRAGQVQADIQLALTPVAALCDLITGERATRHLGNETSTETRYDKYGRNPRQVSVRSPHRDRVLLSAGDRSLFTANSAEDLEAAIFAHPHLAKARKIAAKVHATHIPVQFPEVFRRDRDGFDCILGNPPWEKLHVEEHNWWALRFPGLRAMTQRDRDNTIAQLQMERQDLHTEYVSEVEQTAAAAAIISTGPFPGIGDAHLDLFAAFCWRFWHEIRVGGKVGVVLPRGALAGAATGDWRTEVLASGQFTEMTLLVNNRQWMFDKVHPQYTIGLVTLTKGDVPRTVTLHGPYSSHSEYAEARDADAAPVIFQATEVAKWTGNAAFPLLPNAESAEVFAAMQRHPGVSADVGPWRFRPIQGDMNATTQKSLLDFDMDKAPTKGQLEVWTGASFNLWAPGSGEPYAYADAVQVTDFLSDRRKSQIRRSNSAFFGMSEKWASDRDTLPARSARIAFRDVARATDSRTMICALVPPNTPLVHKSPFLFRMRGDERDDAYLLGVLSSIPFDWYSRRYVEITMSFELLGALPVPRVTNDSGATVDKDGSVLDDSRDLRPIRDRLLTLSGSLAAIDSRFSEWAKNVGVETGIKRTQAETADALAEIDALVALLYGLSRHQLNIVFSTFHRGWQYQDRLEAALVHFEAWNSSLAVSAAS